jgi:hypothetical protein
MVSVDFMARGHADLARHLVACGLLSDSGKHRPSIESGVAKLRHEEFDMTTFTRCALASAMALAFAVSASAQTSSGTSSGTAGSATTAGSTSGSTGATTSGTTGATTSGTRGATTSGTTGATTSGTAAANGGNHAMRGPSANANMPTECASLTGQELGQCLKDHGGASGNGASGTGNTLGRSPMKNDKSTQGSSGSGNAMGSTAGTNDTGAGGTGGASSSLRGTTGK